MLNVTPDHVVRHGSLEVYQQMKEKLFAHQTKDDYLVLNYDDVHTRSMDNIRKAFTQFIENVDKKSGYAVLCFENENIRNIAKQIDRKYLSYAIEQPADYQAAQIETNGAGISFDVMHDEDLLKVVNELRAAGAEAVSINGQRMTATSELRCAGPTLSVNNVRSAPPYEIRAIGDIKTLENALKMRGGVAETLKVWGISMDIRTSENVLVPAYKGSTKLKYGKVTDRQEETP